MLSPSNQMPAVHLLQVIVIVTIGALIGDRLITCLYTLLSSSNTNQSIFSHSFASSLHDVNKTRRRRQWLPDLANCCPCLRTPHNPPSLGRRYLRHLPRRTTGSTATNATGADEIQQQTWPYTGNRDRYKDDLECVEMLQILTSLVDKYPDKTYLIHESTDKSSEDLSLYVKRKHSDGTTEWLGNVAEFTHGQGFRVKLHHADAEVVREHGWATNRPGRKVRWSWLVWLGTSMGGQWVSVHGPRGTEDLAILQDIVRAAVGCAASGDGMEWDEEAMVAGNAVPKAEIRWDISGA